MKRNFRVADGLTTCKESACAIARTLKASASFSTKGKRWRLKPCKASRMRQTRTKEKSAREKCLKTMFRKSILTKIGPTGTVDSLFAGCGQKKSRAAWFYPCCPRFQLNR